MEEAAAFWDSHDFTDLGDQPEPVTVDVERPLEHIVSVRLAIDDFRRLAATARQQEVNLVALAERWVLEALARVEASGPSAPVPPTVSE